MFDNDLFEFFSRIPPWQPPVIFIPIIAWALYSSVIATSIALTGLLFLVGLLHWTLLEYWAHRVLFHWEPQSNIGKKFVWYLHGVHHDWPNDKYRLVFPPALSVPLAALHYYLYVAIFGPLWAFGAFAGLTFGYLAYDMIHYYTHHFAPKDPVMKYLRKYHMAHHFKHEPTRYGVSSPLWDYVFGTAPARR